MQARATSTPLPRILLACALVLAAPLLAGCTNHVRLGPATLPPPARPRSNATAYLAIEGSGASLRPAFRGVPWLGFVQKWAFDLEPELGESIGALLRSHTQNVRSERAGRGRMRRDDVLVLVELTRFEVGKVDMGTEVALRYTIEDAEGRRVWDGAVHAESRLKGFWTWFKIYCFGYFAGRGALSKSANLALEQLYDELDRDFARAARSGVFGR